MSDSLLLVGRVFRPHGVRGEVKVIPETDDPERLEGIETLFIGSSPEAAEPVGVEIVRFQHVRQGITVIVKLVGVDSREEAVALRDQSVYAREEDLPPLDEGEFFLHELIGLAVFAEDGGAIGTVDDVLSTPAHDTIVVRRDEGQDVLIPLVDEFVADIDLDEERIVIRPIEGLLE